MPPKKPDAVTTAPVLSDISPFYLTEKSEWGLFKKAITSCLFGTSLIGCQRLFIKVMIISR